MELAGEGLGARGVPRAAGRLEPELQVRRAIVEDAHAGAEIRGPLPAEALDRLFAEAHREASIPRMVLVVAARELEPRRGDEHVFRGDLAPSAASQPQPERAGVDEADRVASRPLALGVAVRDAGSVIEALQDERRRVEER